MTLSEDDICNVFSWLPAKSICKFKSSCKSLCDFSSETHFAMTQAHNSFLKDDSCLFVEPYSFKGCSDKIEMHPLPGHETSSGVPEDFLIFLTKSARILASSNGLLLCRNVGKYEVELFICNPATRSWLPIPTPKCVQQKPNVDIRIAFECNRESLDLDDYMIFLIGNPIGDWSSFFECEVYSPKVGVWKATETSFFTGSRNLRFDMPAVFYNGAFHYISDSFSYFHRQSPYYRPYIVSYNPKGISRMLRLPKEARRGSHDDNCNMKIFKWGKVTGSTESICLVRLRKSIFTIWVLREYKSSLWTRILKIRIRAMGLREYSFNVAGFTVMNGDSLIFATAKKIYTYGLDGEAYGRLEEIREHGCGSNVSFTSYSNTLRPCGAHATTITSYNNDNSVSDEDGICNATI